MHINKIYSPNFSYNLKKTRKIMFVIIHYTGMQSTRESLKRLKNYKSKVSCHYLIDREGKITSMVKDRDIAWHAGKSRWMKFKNLNPYSIGIELQNKGHKLKYENYTNEQINSLIKICKILKKKYKLKKSSFLGHSDIAPNRKVDPGEKFPWNKLSKKGLGICIPKKISLKKLKLLNSKQTNRLFLKNLKKIGYRYLSSSLDKKSEKNTKVIKAFQMRFYNKNIDGKINRKMLEISEFIAKNKDFP